ncbi:MAG: hypothetical protein IH963_09890 [Chloroflexi bacterium]|nr:hypothetical protein [Chloroflexota bacterium]
MAWFRDVAFIALAASYKWLLAAVVIVGIVVGSLFAAGVFGGSGESSRAAPPPTPSPAIFPTPTPMEITTPTATPTPTARPPATPTVRPTPTPTVRPSPTPLPTPTPSPSPSPTAAPTPVPPPETIEIAVSAAGANNVGSLEFVLGFEPTVLAVMEVAPGTLSSNAIMEFNSNIPGRLWTGLVDLDGITGDGPVAVITFRILGDSAADSFLTLTNVLAHDATTLVDIVALTSAGNFTGIDRSFTPPSLDFHR